jgi:hypothetical protein
MNLKQLEIPEQVIEREIANSRDDELRLELAAIFRGISHYMNQLKKDLSTI